MLKSCFAAGTPLRTPEGSRPIEEFRAGDLILSRPDDDPDAAVTVRRIEEVFASQAFLRTLTVAGREIRTTPEHPFWVLDKGWTAADRLQAGDLVASESGAWLTVEGVRDTGEFVPVYNMRIAEDATYFVGEAGWGFAVWAHNAKCLPVHGRPQHGSDWHNRRGTGLADELSRRPGVGDVRWNQDLYDPSRGRIGAKRPDIQYIRDGKIYIVELQSPGQSDEYMEHMRKIYQELLKHNFGDYEWIKRPKMH